jgi:hypothetical protein
VVVAARVGRVWDVWRPWQNTKLSTVEGRDLQVNEVGLFTWYALIPLAIAGAVVARRRGETLLPPLAMAAMVTATATYAYGAVRFRAPAEVAMIVLAGLAVDGWLAGWARRRRVPLAPLPG